MAYNPFGQVQNAQINGANYQFARGADRALYYNDGTGWKSLGGVLESDPFVQVGAGGPQVFARGTNGDVFQISKGPTGFGGWADIGQAAPSGASQLAANNAVHVNNPLGSHILNGTTDVSLNPNNAVASGNVEGGGFNTVNGVPQFGYTVNNHFATVLPMEHLIGRASAYMSRGLSEQDAYQLALGEEMTQLNQRGIAPSTYRLLAYRPGIVTTLAPYINGNQYGQIGSNPQAAAIFNEFYGKTGGYEGSYGSPAAGQPAPSAPGGVTPQNPADKGPIYTTQPVPNQGNPQLPGQGGALNTVQKQYLADDPQAAFRYLMQQRGYNLDAPGLASAYLKNKYQNLVPAYENARSLAAGGQDFVGNIDTYLSDLGNALFSGGAGSPAAGFSQVARQATSGAGLGYLNDLQDQTQAEDFAKQMAYLDSFFANPAVTQALADRFDRIQNQYGDLSFRQELGQGHNIDPFLTFVSRLQGGLYGR